METTTAHPRRIDERNAVSEPGRAQKVVRTRLRQTRLSPREPGTIARWLDTFRREFAVVWRRAMGCLRRAPKRLVVSETAALGERRIVSVVQFEEQRFLIGCSPSSVTLLARLPDAGGSEAGPLDGSAETGNSRDGDGE